MLKNLNSNNIHQRPIRILHVLTAMNRAGTETMLMNLYRAIDRDRVQFDFAVTTTAHCDYDDEIKALGGRLIHYPRYTGLNHLNYIKWWNKFFGSHPEYRIIHGHIGSTASIYLKIAKKYGCYTIAHSHSTGGDFNLHNFLYKLLSFNTRYISDYFIGCSTEALVSRYGKRVAESKGISCVLNNGIDVSKYVYSSRIKEEVQKELGIPNDILVIGTIGRFTEAKNIFFILDILTELKKREPNFKFIWVGTGELKKQIEKDILEKKLQNNVLLLGVRNDIPRVLQVLNVFILPSKFEGLPVIGVEVQAAGVPMLCSNKVSPEVNMTKCVQFLPINSVEPWINGILNEKEFRRVDGSSEDVIKAGYDVGITSKWLMDFYESHYCE